MLMLMEEGPKFLSTNSFFRNRIDHAKNYALKDFRIVRMFKPLNCLFVMFFVDKFPVGIVVHTQHVVKQTCTDDGDPHIENFRAIVDMIV